MSRGVYQWMMLILLWPVTQLANASDMNFIITLDRPDLQRRIERMFPIVREDQLVRVRLHHPQVILAEHSNRIGLRISVDATAVEQLSVSGLTRVDGMLRYSGDTGEFFLDDASVEELQIEGVPQLYADEIRQVADNVIRDVLHDQPIYSLGQMGESKRIMGSELKSVTVRDGKLIVELAMP